MYFQSKEICLLDNKENEINDKKSIIKKLELKVSNIEVEVKELQDELNRKEMIGCDYCEEISDGLNEFKTHHIQNS